MTELPGEWTTFLADSELTGANIIVTERTDLDRFRRNPRFKYCITVGREFCSGGIETAKQVADALDMAYYDKEIIDKTAEMMNLNKDIIASA